MRATVLNEGEISTLFAYVANMQRPKMYHLMMLLTQRLGLRPVEIANMQTSWFSASELRIPQGSSKGNACRSLPIGQDIIEALVAHMGRREGFVFTNANGEQFTRNGISEALRRIYRLAGVKGSAYSGRRTSATNMMDRGVSLRVIQDYLGHQHLSTTAAYCSTTPNMLRKAIYG